MRSAVSDLSISTHIYLPGQGNGDSVDITRSSSSSSWGAHILEVLNMPAYIKPARK